MDDVRRRTVDNAKTEAAGLRIRIEQFLKEYGGKGAQLLTIMEEIDLEVTSEDLLAFTAREVR
jgi:hypothetical protein